MNLAERLAALQKVNDGLNEEELKAAYLERLCDGELPDEAAKGVGKTATWFRRRRSEKSVHYDFEFAERYEEIMHPDGEHRAALIQRARSALVDAASSGNVRAIEKILMAYDPDFQFLRPPAFAGDTYNVDKLIQIMPGIPTPLLQQVREALVQQREVVDA